MRGGCLLLIVALAALLAGYFGKDLLARQEEFPTGSVVLGFQRQNELTVFAAQVVTVPTSRVAGMIGALDRTQTDIYPAKVRYTVDLSRLTERDVRWNPAARTLTVTVPPVAVQPPELDGTSRRTFRTGPPASAANWDGFARSNVVKARREAVRLASTPDLMRLANAAAREAIRGNAELFLRAQSDDAKVVVRFATEGRSTGEIWNQSRNVSEVLSERR